MGETIDMVADDPSEAPAFGGSTRVLSERELSGLLAEDARAAPAASAHPVTVRRETLSETSAVPEQVDEPDPWQHPAASSLQATPPAQPATSGRAWWLVIALIAVAAAAALLFASGLR